MAGCSGCHRPKLFKSLVDLCQETHRIEPQVLVCQYVALLLGQHIRVQESSVWSLGRIIHFVNPSPVSGLALQLHHRLEEIDLASDQPATPSPNLSTAPAASPWGKTWSAPSPMTMWRHREVMSRPPRSRPPRSPGVTNRVVTPVKVTPLSINVSWEREPNGIHFGDPAPERPGLPVSGLDDLTS